MSKYEPLARFLQQMHATVTETTLTFGQLEQILGFELPHSAYTHRPWWANPTSAYEHPYAQSWLGVGWKADTVDLQAQWVRLRRMT
jgi:hypothetical protein